MSATRPKVTTAAVGGAASRPVPVMSARTPFEPTHDPVVGEPIRPGGPGLYLHWDGRRTYRTRMPAPRVLQPVAKLSFGVADGNRIIEGDNLQVMVSLRSQYRGTIDVAYLDPPYNTGKNDFRYSDRRFLDPNADSDDAVYVRNEDGGRHTKWLNYMGPRLWLTYDLLADHGVCFVSINDIELFRLGLLMDEIFGEPNRLGILVWKQAIDNNPTRIVTEHEYVLCYAKDKEKVPAIWTGENEVREWLLTSYERLKAKHSRLKDLQRAYKEAITEHIRQYERDFKEGGETELVNLGRAKRYSRVDKRGPYAAEDNTHNPRLGGYVYDVPHPVTRKTCKKPVNGYRFPEDRFKELLAEGRIEFGDDHTQLFKIKKYVSEMGGPLRSVFAKDARLGTKRLQKLVPDSADRFPHPKPVELIEYLLSFGGDADALVLDPVAGSGTTGEAVLRLNAADRGRRRFILIEEGTPTDHYCRTLTAPRIKAAIKLEGYKAGFTFEETGRQLNRDAILDLERETISNLIIQTDITGAGRGITKVTGTYVIGHNARREAICLIWNGRTDSTVTREVLVAMYDEVKALGLNKPMRVYGSTCMVGETDSFRFCQIPDEILAALQLVDEDPADGEREIHAE
jgi:adenine-specific DNA-methyltransferase